VAGCHLLSKPDDDLSLGKVPSQDRSLTTRGRFSRTTPHILIKWRYFYSGRYYWYLETTIIIKLSLTSIFASTPTSFNPKFRPQLTSLLPMVSKSNSPLLISDLSILPFFRKFLTIETTFDTPFSGQLLRATSISLYLRYSVFGLHALRPGVNIL